MIDSNLLRSNPDAIRKALQSRNNRFDLDNLLELDKNRREGLGELEKLSAEKNRANDEISRLIKEKQDAGPKIAQMKAVAKKIDEIRPQVDGLVAAVEEKLLFIPNLPHADVPVGDITANRVVREAGEKKTFSFELKNHVEICESLNLVDFKRASKVSGTGFLLFTGEGARLERALIQFMLDLHVREHGYTEISAPFIVKRHCMQGTGQLPKFEDDMYRVYRGSADDENGKPSDNDMFLIPTAEVPVTNIHREETLVEEQLPVKYVGYTPCFRLEAGAYGQDTKGMVRVHQFDKVELVKFTKPETSYEEHEKLTKDATDIFDKLDIPYRVLLLSTGDMGFAAAKCYDIEVWAPGMGKWLEASSCSNFEDFQARRAGIKFKDKATNKPRFVHTINGSGVALARTFIAVIENYQQSDGSILIPEALRSYMGGQTHIKRPNKI